MGIYADHQRLVFSDLEAKESPAAGDSLVVLDSATSRPKKITIGSLPIAQAQMAAAVLQPEADAAVEIDATVAGVQLTVTGENPIAITTNANSYAGQKVHLFAVAVAGGGSYTLELDAGTLTFDAAGESAVIMRNAANDAWICVGLTGATIA